MVGAFLMEIFMGKMVACALILMAMLLGVALLGVDSDNKSMGDIFR